jgi:hypothetical protein
LHLDASNALPTAPLQDDSDIFEAIYDDKLSLDDDTRSGIYDGYHEGLYKWLPRFLFVGWGNTHFAELALSSARLLI